MAEYGTYGSHMTRVLSIDRLCIAMSYHTDSRKILRHEEKLKEFEEC